MSPMGIHQKPLQTIYKENSIDGSPIHQTHIANNTNNINKVHREINLMTYKRFLSERHFL